MLKKRNFQIGILLLIMLCGGLPPASSFAQMSWFWNMVNPLVGKEYQDVRLPRLDGSSGSFSEQIKNKKAILIFWATWCTHCRRMLSRLQERIDTYRGEGIEIVLINVGEPSSVVRKYMRSNDLSLDVYADRKGEVSEMYEVQGLPTFYAIDEEGIVTRSGHALPKKIQQLF